MIECKAILLTTTGFVVAAATGIWAATAPSDSADDLDVTEIEKRLADLEKRVLALEGQLAPPTKPGKPFGVDPRDPSDRPEVKRLQKGLADLEKRIERLEKRPPSSSWRFRLPRGLDGPVPRGWQPWEFNGRTYYWIPLTQGLGPGTAPTLCVPETCSPHISRGVGPCRRDP